LLDERKALITDNVLANKYSQLTDTVTPLWT